MNTYTVTVTSKNQITLPAELVRRMKLSKKKQLVIKEHIGKLEVSVKPSLQETLSKYHRDHYAQAALRPEDEAAALADIISNKATR